MEEMENVGYDIFVRKYEGQRPFECLDVNEGILLKSIVTI